MRNYSWNKGAEYLTGRDRNGMKYTVVLRPDLNRVNDDFIPAQCSADGMC